jgi:hypothetical protein
MICVPQERQTGKLLEEFPDASNSDGVSNMVLGQGFWPAADHGNVGSRERSKQARQLMQASLNDEGVIPTPKFLGGGTAVKAA